MIFEILFAFTVVHLTTAFNISAGDCVTKWDNRDEENRPLLFLGSEFVYPEYSSVYPPGLITVKHGQTLEIVCYPNFIKYNLIKIGMEATAICENGAFKINDISYDLFFLRCSSKPKHEAATTRFKCPGEHQEILIGYGREAINEQMKICFNKESLLTISSTFTLTKSIAQHKKNVKASTFRKDFFKDVNMEKLYEKTEQIKSINTLFKYPYIINDAEHYLACGHLSAKADFVYAIQQEATYYYLNGVPQWQMINNGNWRQVEVKVREFADVAKKDFSITTGTHGVATLRENGNLYGKSHPLKLSYGGKEIPVPALIWKLVHDPQLKQAVVIISINNPYFKDPEEKCTNILPSLYWLKLAEPENLKKGYIYACNYKEAKKEITELPPIDVTGLLL